ncbi:hypothetical protein LEMLEM_LOCUS6307, partial [Lemmus lemmus]
MLNHQGHSQATEQDCCITLLIIQESWNLWDGGDWR